MGFPCTATNRFLYGLYQNTGSGCIYIHLLTVKTVFGVFIRNSFSFLFFFYLIQPTRTVHVYNLKSFWDLDNTFHPQCKASSLKDRKHTRQRQVSIRWREQEYSHQSAVCGLPLEEIIKQLRQWGHNQRAL